MSKSLYSFIADMKKEETATIRLNKEVIKQVKIYAAGINSSVKEFTEKVLIKNIKPKPKK